jgi:Family of unknown function (DUF5675)
MEVTLQRLKHNETATIGEMLIDGKFECYIVEDEPRKIKVKGETRIPAGRYKLSLQTWGRHHERYKAAFDFHKGTIALNDVPGFSGILFHVGNTERDTMGCLCPGTAINGFTVIQSTVAYSRAYKRIVGPLAAGEDVFIEVKDEK